jgi:NAD(P)-dependent dehydrogenase (short-subunit alcohol dehydrogenase family)
MNRGERVIIVTGASTNIGNSCAMYLAKKGNKVYAAWRNPEKYIKKADEFFNVLKMNSEDEASINEAIDSVFRLEGRIDALVTGNGPCLAGAVEETSVDEAKLQMENLFYDSFREIKAILPYMRKQGRGRIVLLSCMAGWTGIPYHALYSSGRFAAEGLAESLRYELKPFNIHVSIVEPSNFRIGMEYSSMTAKASSMKSPYKEACDRISGKLLKKNISGPEIVGVAKKVIHILEAQQPHLRYSVGGGFQSFALGKKRYLVSRFYERAMSRFFSA